MRKILVIARREYLASVQTKAFLISMFLMPVLMGGSVLVQKILQSVGDLQEKQFVIVDRTGENLFADLKTALKSPETNELPNPDKDAAPSKFIIHNEKPSLEGKEKEQRYLLSERVRRGEIFGFAEIGPDVLVPAPKKKKQSEKIPDRFVILYQTNSPTYLQFSQWLERAVNRIVEEKRAAKKGVSVQNLKEITRKVPLESKGLSTRNSRGDIIEAPSQNAIAPFAVSFGLMMLMFMIIMVGATPLMQGIVEEKMQRIAEVLLGSVRPFELMLGKLLGMVGVALTLVSVYMAGIYWAAHHFGMADYLPPGLIAWFFVYQVLAVLMYGSLFIAIGAACTDMKETQTLLMPIMLIVCMPMFVITNVIREPNSDFAFWMSLFPPATPMLMIGRQAVPPHLELWQPVLGVIVVLAATLACVYAAGRIFRVGILMQGKGARFSDLIRWVWRG
jgi:ABC-2 type transport system permease protein